MSVYQNLMSKIDNAGLLFNVESHEVQTAGGIAIPNKRAIINTSNNAVMSVVSDTYKVVPNEEIYSAFCKSIEASDIDTTDAMVNVKQTATGSRAMVDFVFPAHQITVAKDSSPTSLQICALNSFDGSTRYMTKAGGLRMKCLNGQILGDVVGAYSHCHTKSLDVDMGAAVVCQMVQEFQNASEYWGAMMKRRVSKATAIECIYKFLNCKLDERGNPVREDNERLVHCLNLHKSYSRELGHNAYALYNVFTDYITHYQPRSADPAKRQMSVRSKGAKAIAALPVFAELQQAA